MAVAMAAAAPKSSSPFDPRAVPLPPNLRSSEDALRSVNDDTSTWTLLVYLMMQILKRILYANLGIMKTL